MSDDMWARQRPQNDREPMSYGVDHGPGTRIVIGLCPGCEREPDDCMCGPEGDGCPGCLSADAPRLLDEDGTLSSVSGRPGRMGHAVDDYYWFCEDYQRERPTE